MRRSGGKLRCKVAGEVGNGNRRHQVTFDRLDDAAWPAWRQLAAAVIGDSMGRAGCMCAAIKSLLPGVKLVGHARTVTTMVGDNSTVHAALEFLQQGDVLVIDAGGSCEVAIWGAVITEAAVMREVAGVAIDGARSKAVAICRIEAP